MTFLPIVGRELRVASRKRSTFWVRVIAALVAVVIGSGFLVLAMVGGLAFGVASLGKGLFATLTWLSLAAALSAGLFLTSDCLSEEKREGTLGFLFLTDLHGYDIVLGKLAVTSLRGLYALLAVLPILAVTLLMGGVSGVQLWKTSLALLNAMFLSLVAGLFVSAISRESQKAMGATLLLLIVLAGGGPAADSVIEAVTHGTSDPALGLTSPVLLFVLAGAWVQTPFWTGLLCNQIVAWTLLGLTCVLLPRTWQERARKPSTFAESRTYRWKFGSAKSREALRRKLVEANPVLWLACRERWQAWSLWLLAIMLAGGFAATFNGDGQSGRWIAWSFLGGMFTLMLYGAVASQAARFFIEAQRNGLMELLLATPLTVREIVQGQWRGLLRMFGPPLAVCLAVQLLGTFMAQQLTWNQFATITPAGPPTATTTTNASGMTNVTVVTTTSMGGTVMVSAGGITAPNEWFALAMSAAGTLTVLANLAALAWFGMWMGLNSRNTNVATAKTILFVQVIPWFVISFASALVFPALMFSKVLSGNATAAIQNTVVWFPLIMAAVSTTLNLAKDIGFVTWSRRKLYAEFRERAAQAFAPIHPALPPQLPGAVPPILTQRVSESSGPAVPS